MSQRNGYKNKPRPSPYPGNWKERKPISQDNNEQSIYSDPQNLIDNKEEGPVYPSGPGASGSGMAPFQEYQKEKKFGNRARLYVGNLPRQMTEEELMGMFQPYGDIKQVYIEKDKNFGFVRMAYRKQSEQAISALNGIDCKGRELRVRLAASSCSIRVDNLHSTVSNELLHQAFSEFGEVEYAVVVTDERGKPLGHGVIDFAKKSQAMMALEKCRQGCFFLTRSPIPVTVSELLRENEDDGLPERSIVKNNQFIYERDAAPRMAQPNTSEYDFGMRYKELCENERRQKEDIENHYREARKQLELELEQYKHHEHATVLRLQLAEYQKEQVKIQRRLQQHEEYLKGPPPPPSLAPPTNIVPVNNMMPPSHMVPGPPLPLGAPPPMLPPQPLMDTNHQGALIGGTAPPPFLLPSPSMGQQLPPPS